MTSGPNRTLWAVLALAVCLASIALLASRLHYGFLPEDDASHAELGTRALAGELPNVDFNDNYTGGLSYLNALAFRMFGLRLISPRIMLLIFFVPFVPTVWYLAQRITSPFNALLVTCFAVVWSVPVYPMPFGSWYNLYFATFGTAALFRYLDSRKRLWIFVAGVSGGLSFLAKISGLYFVAAMLLFLIYDEQNANFQTQVKHPHPRGYPVLLSAGLLVFAAALIQLVRSNGSAVHYYHFVLPGVAIAVFLATREWKAARAPFANRLRGIGIRLGAFTAGVAVPVALFLLRYAERHAISQWAASILRSSARLHNAAHAPLPLTLALVSIPLLLVVWLNGENATSRSRRTINIAVWVALAAVLAISLGKVIASRLVWFSFADSIPLLVLFGVWLAWPDADGEKPTDVSLFLLACVTAMCSVVAFPFTAPMYFCFVAPLVILTLTALFERERSSTRGNSLLTPVLTFYLVFGIAAILPGEFYSEQFDRHPEIVSTLPRARGFVGEASILRLYETAVPEVEKHAGTAPIYAGPDATEFYFLTGHPNPTPVFLEFLAGRDGEPDTILRRIDDSGVQTVVINHGGAHNPSGPPTPELLAGLRQRFPQSETIGRFEIRWRP